MTKTLNIGIASFEDYKARTLAIARGEHKPGRNEPKVWFQSMESFAKVLSDKNRALLAIIVETEPASMTALAEATGRAPSNLSRTLKTMERYGLVCFVDGPGRSKAPRAPYSNIVLDVPLAASPG